MRPWTSLIAGFFLIALMPGASQAQAPADDSSAPREAVRRFHAALERGDSAAALALLAEDAVVLEAGGVESRADYGAHHLGADITFAQAVPPRTRSVDVTRVGDTAWVTSTADVVGTFEGRALDTVTAELAVLTRFADGWKIRAIHWSSRSRTPR